MGRHLQTQNIDWIAVEKEYRLGQCSMRQIARMFAIQPSTISRQVRQKGWVQDKTACVEARHSALLRDGCRPEATLKATPKETEIEVAARVKTNVLLGHRKDLERAREIVSRLLSELEGVDDPAGASDTRAPTGAAALASLSARAKVLRTLVDAMCKVVAKEREVFGFNAQERHTDEPLVIIRDFTGRGDRDAPNAAAFE